MSSKKKPKQSLTTSISYGTIESLIETHLRMLHVIHDDEELLDIKWPLGNEHLNHCRRDTVLDLEITTIKD